MSGCSSKSYEVKMNRVHIVNEEFAEWIIGCIGVIFKLIYDIIV